MGRSFSGDQPKENVSGDRHKESVSGDQPKESILSDRTNLVKEHKECFKDGLGML